MTQKIIRQTFLDLGMWLSSPNTYSKKQLSSLLDEDKRLPMIKLANKYWLIGALAHSLKGSNVWLLLDELF